jgi:hypothetical protein
MRLMDVVRDDTMKVPVIENHTYMCSACRHIALHGDWCSDAPKRDHSFAGYNYSNAG